MRCAIFVLCLMTVNCYGPDYTTSQGVGVFEDHCGGTCPDSAVVDNAIEYYATRAPEVLGWDDVRHYLRRIRLYWHSGPINGYNGIINWTAIGWDIDVRQFDNIADSALFHELTHIHAVLSLGHPDYKHESDLWIGVAALKNEYSWILSR